MKSTKPGLAGSSNPKRERPTGAIPRVQELQLELIGLVDHNGCKGKRVARLLRDHRPLWRAAMMPGKHLHPLSEMEYGDWPADTLYILPVEGQEEALEKLAKRFHADELNWLSGRQALLLMGTWKKDVEKNPRLILSLWWD